MHVWVKFFTLSALGLTAAGFVANWLISFGGWCMSQRSDAFVVLGTLVWIVALALLGFALMSFLAQLVLKLEARK